ncbi:MAG: SDR family oxidoreductase [Ilumatobacter sp.]|nr:MAG: SDR family oxidoreductase [Ilumatobacter sp.]
MDLGLNGRRALVSGATRGIGRAIAETLLAEGASVSFCARTADDVADATEAMSRLGTVHGHVVDAADTDAVRGWVAESIEQLGGIDIYVHNTSAGPARDLAGWSANVAVDLMSGVHGVDAATDALTDGGGVVVTIGTTASAEHFATGANSYSAVKAAITNWTLGQAQVLGAKGVRCNVVSPGPIYFEGGSWAMIEQHMKPFFESTQQAHPGGRLGSAQDVADAVAFVVSDRARHINGVNLTVDGGFLKRVDY